MPLSCNGTGQLTLQEIVTAINANETSIAEQKLNDLLDVDSPSPSNGNIIIFNSATGNWESGSLPSSQIQSDYTQTDTNAVDYIKNKPDLTQYEENLGLPFGNGHVLTSDISGSRVWKDANTILSTDLDTVLTSINATITNTSGNDAIIPAATIAVAGVMTATDKSNLDTLWVKIDGGTI